MGDSFIYMPTFRSRQQEDKVLREFDFGERMYPLIEVIKEHDRKRKKENQKSFSEIYLDLIDNISSKHVFVDLPLFLPERSSMKDEVIQFVRKVINKVDVRIAYLESLSASSKRIIPVISSYSSKVGVSYLKLQENNLRKHYKSIAFRSIFKDFDEDWDEIRSLATSDDFVILDLDSIPPYPTPSNKKLINLWKSFDICKKIVLRSTINEDISNVNLEHGEPVFEADNGLQETYRSLGADIFGDYAGVKKDGLTSGGTISPGFIYYDPTNNEFFGYKGNIKNLAEFENTIIPSVVSSKATKNMIASGRTYLVGNSGWDTLRSIQTTDESGKSQAKFKKIAMDHYLHCMKVKIESGDFD